MSFYLHQKSIQALALNPFPRMCTFLDSWKQHAQINRMMGSLFDFACHNDWKFGHYERSRRISHQLSEATKPMQVPPRNGCLPRHSMNSVGNRGPTLTNGTKNMNIVAVGVKQGIYRWLFGLYWVFPCMICRPSMGTQWSGNICHGTCFEANTH